MKNIPASVCAGNVDRRMLLPPPRNAGSVAIHWFFRFVFFFGHQVSIYELNN